MHGCLTLLDPNRSSRSAPSSNRIVVKPKHRATWNPCHAFDGSRLSTPTPSKILSSCCAHAYNTSMFGPCVGPNIAALPWASTSAHTGHSFRKCPLDKPPSFSWSPMAARLLRQALAYLSQRISPLGQTLPVSPRGHSICGIVQVPQGHPCVVNLQPWLHG